MKYFLFSFLSISLTSISAKAVSQESGDSVMLLIRNLESKEAAALSRGDLPALYDLWDENFVYSQNGRNIPLIELRGILANQKFTNKPIYRSYGVYISGDNVAVAVGGSSSNENFSDVWVKRNNRWRLFLRHEIVQTK